MKTVLFKPTGLLAALIFLNAGLAKAEAGNELGIVHALAKAMFRQVSAQRVKTNADIPWELKEKFLSHLNQATQILETRPVICGSERSAKALVLNQQGCKQFNNSLLAMQLATETLRQAGFSDEEAVTLMDKIDDLIEPSNLSRSVEAQRVAQKAVTQNVEPLTVLNESYKELGKIPGFNQSEENYSKIATSFIRSLSPEYQAIMLPGGLGDAHKRINAEYDKYAGIRQNFREQFLYAIQNIRPDKNGVMNLEIETSSYEGRSESGMGISPLAGYMKTGIGYRRMSSDLGPAYVDAINEALTPMTGLKIGGVGSKYNEIFGGDWHAGAESGPLPYVQMESKQYLKSSGKFIVFVVPDMDAERKVEILKIKSFNDIEKAADYARRQVLQGWTDNQVEMQFLGKLLANGNQIDMVSIRTRIESIINTSGFTSTTAFMGRSIDNATRLNDALRSNAQIEVDRGNDIFQALMRDLQFSDTAKIKKQAQDAKKYLEDQMANAPDITPRIMP